MEVLDHVCEIQWMEYKDGLEWGVCFVCGMQEYRYADNHGG